jgi:tetratricopeptide (TPR) repeat protein
MNIVSSRVWLLATLSVTPTLAFLFSIQANKVALALAPVILNTGFLPSREVLPTISIPTCVSKLHPLPEEELTTSFNLGNSLLVVGKFNEALNELNTAIELAPDRGVLYETRGIIYEKLDRFEDAIDDYKFANKMYKKAIFGQESSIVYSNLANAETGLGKWEDALKHFEKSYKMNPEFVAPQLGKNLVLFQLGKDEEAFTFFSDLADKYPIFADGRAALAVMYFSLRGDMDSANENWKIAVAQDSRYTDVEWVEDIRRWPPKLVDALKLYLSKSS